MVLHNDMPFHFFFFFARIKAINISVRQKYYQQWSRFIIRLVLLFLEVRSLSPPQPATFAEEGTVAVEDAILTFFLFVFFA